MHASIQPPTGSRQPHGGLPQPRHRRRGVPGVEDDPLGQGGHPCPLSRNPVCRRCA